MQKKISTFGVILIILGVIAGLYTVTQTSFFGLINVISTPYGIFMIPLIIIGVLVFIFGLFPNGKRNEEFETGKKDFEINLDLDKLKRRRGNKIIRTEQKCLSCKKEFQLGKDLVDEYHEEGYISFECPHCEAEFEAGIRKAVKKNTTKTAKRKRGKKK